MDDIGCLGCCENIIVSRVDVVCFGNVSKWREFLYCSFVGSFVFRNRWIGRSDENFTALEVLKRRKY